ncbi:MAG: 4Fe-4S binding protein [Planctomycetota bacterium]|nr:4Fe-4S binding protein [Planctomycetota bacterium]
MIRSLRARLQQGHRTMKFPDGPPPALPERFRGMPAIEAARCTGGCRDCAKVCPTGALGTEGGLGIDLGRCLFCGACERACPNGAVRFTSDYRLATRTREALRVSGQPYALAEALGAEMRRLLGRSLRLRQVSAGGCNACEADANVLTTVGWDIGRFGIQFVASPRHADGLLVTGPVSENMKLALEKTYAAVPTPKIVIASGACAISGGPYIDHPEVHNGAASVVPVDLFVPGCPPHPLVLLDGLLRFLGRV